MLVYDRCMCVGVCMSAAPHRGITDGFDAHPGTELGCSTGAVHSLAAAISSDLV